MDDLTGRELQVLSLRALALTTKSIGMMLGISEQTVKNHQTNAYAKLGAAGAVDAFRILGWLHPPTTNVEVRKRVQHDSA